MSKGYLLKTVYHSNERLSDPYKSYERKPETVPEPDFEAMVHVYDFRMTLAEVLDYIENGTVPKKGREEGLIKQLVMQVVKNFTKTSR